MPTPEELKLADVPPSDLDLADVPPAGKKPPISFGESLRRTGGSLLGGLGPMAVAIASQGRTPLPIAQALIQPTAEKLRPELPDSPLAAGIPQFTPSGSMTDITRRILNFVYPHPIQTAGEIGSAGEAITRSPELLTEPLLDVLPFERVLRGLGVIGGKIGKGAAKAKTAELTMGELEEKINASVARAEKTASGLDQRIQNIVNKNVEAMRADRISTEKAIQDAAEESGLAFQGKFPGEATKKTGEFIKSEYTIKDPITNGNFNISDVSELPEALIAHRKTWGLDPLGNPLPKPANTLDRFVKAIESAIPLRKEQKKLYSEELSKRAARVAAAGRDVGGESGLYAQLSQLKGPLPKKTFEAIRGQFSQTEIDGLFDAIEGTSTLLPFEKVNSKVGLQKLLDGAVPTEGEINLLRETFPKEVVDAVLARRPLLQRLRGHIGEALNLPRAILASTDLSAPFRQGVFMMGRTKRFGQAFGSMFKYFGSEKAYHGLIESIKARPTYLEMKRGGLALTEIGGSLLKREERFMSQLAEKIPVLGRAARASNRAYTGFLDKLRADVFDDILAKANKLGIKPTDELLQSMGDFINAGTGRGKFGLAETGIIPKSMSNAAVVMNGVFFSPRLMASRLNLLNPNFYVEMHPLVRREALKTLMGTAGIWATTYGLWKLNGGDVGVDPRSADFGKLKIGNTRYDPLGGFQQYIRLASQLISGEVVSSTTGRTTTLGEGYKPLTRKDILIRFFENKESPIASFITGMLSGTDATGRRFDIPTEVIARFIPMMVQDLYELSQEEGAEGLMGGIPAVFGVGVQSYGKQELKRGENVIGDTTVGIAPIDNLAEKMRELVVGKLPIRQSTQFSVDAYYDQLEKLPPEQRQQIFQEIARNNRDLAERILDVRKRRLMGVTVKDEDLKTKGVASGERAMAIKKQLDKLPDYQDKQKLINEYIAKGIITSDVLLQINRLHARELPKER